MIDLGEPASGFAIRAEHGDEGGELDVATCGVRLTEASKKVQCPGFGKHLPEYVARYSDWPVSTETGWRMARYLVLTTDEAFTCACPKCGRVLAHPFGVRKGGTSVSSGGPSPNVGSSV